MDTIRIFLINNFYVMLVATLLFVFFAVIYVCAKASVDDEISNGVLVIFCTLVLGGLICGCFGGVEKSELDNLSSTYYKDPVTVSVKKWGVDTGSNKPLIVETTNGKQIKVEHENVHIKTSIKVSHTKIELRKYRLKKKWYGIHSAEKEKYVAYCTMPPDKVEKNKTK